ncbi:urea carboxylase, partial [Cronobacter sakazakii]
LRPGDVLAISRPALAACTTPAPILPPRTPEPGVIPRYGEVWNIGVLYGPHAETVGVVMHLADGGEAGLHPSNVHDCEYAIGAINFTGDFPVILTRDGPSLGGFVCPVTIARAELWKVGQVKPGDRIRFHPISIEHAQ